MIILDDPLYKSLATVFKMAHAQASKGKGKARHEDDGVSFKHQDMCSTARSHGVGFTFGQAEKKLREASRMLDKNHHDKQSIIFAVVEALGAINYIAGGVIVLAEKHGMPR